MTFPRVTQLAGHSRNLKPGGPAPELMLFSKLLWLISPSFIQPYQSLNASDSAWVASGFPLFIVLIPICISYLLPCTKLPQNICLKQHTYITSRFLLVGILAQRSWVFWFWVSHKPTVTSRLKLTAMAVGRKQLLVGCWTEAWVCLEPLARGAPCFLVMESSS